MNDWRYIIDKFNNDNRIRDVVEICTGEQIKGKSLCCPIHGGDNKNGASIEEGKNIFTCWTSDCGRGLNPWWFVKKYYGLETNKDVAEKVNQLFNANIPIYEKGQNEKNIVPLNNNFDNTFKVKRYLNECNVHLKSELLECSHILLNANTGLGKTYGITEINQDTSNDYVFFLVSTRSLAEDVANEYGYKLFYGNDTEFPQSKFIVSTFKKIDAINRELDKINEYRALANEMLVSYTVIVDEIHELMSKRQMYGGNLCRRIEEFVINSDYSILMSANTGSIYDAYNGTNLFSRYIKVESDNELYNSDKTIIYRIPSKEKQRTAILLNKIKENLLTHNNVLLMEDSKENLKTYTDILLANDIPVIHINSENKNDEDVANEYNSIVNNSELKNTVVMCTSLINAGVNIKNENVCVMVIQNKLQFDSDKVEQFFGRIRSDKNNTCILFLNQGEKNKFKSSKKYYIDYYTRLAELKAQSLNEYYFNKYGLESVKFQIMTDWNIYKNNESYADVKDIIYLANDIFKVDHVAIHEKARLRWLKDNYYNDDFIREIFKDLKTREFIIITVAPITELEEMPSVEEDTDMITFNRALKNVISDINSVKEFNMYVRGTKKPKDFECEPNKVLYDNFKTNKDFRSLSSELKSLMSKLLMIENTTPLSTMLNIMVEYQVEQKKKERDENIKNIKRVEVYNKQFPLNEDVSVIGDTVYTVVRKNCDCFVGSRNTVSKTAYNCMYTDYMTLNNCTYKDNDWYDVKGKKIKPKTIKALLSNCILAIYNCTDKLFLANLK